MDWLGVVPFRRRQRSWADEPPPLGGVSLPGRGEHETGGVGTRPSMGQIESGVV